MEAMKQKHNKQHSKQNRLFDSPYSEQEFENNGKNKKYGKFRKSKRQWQ